MTIYDNHSPVELTQLDIKTMKGASLCRFQINCFQHNFGQKFLTSLPEWSCTYMHHIRDSGRHTKDRWGFWKSWSTNVPVYKSCLDFLFANQYPSYHHGPLYIFSRCICLWACFCLTNSSNSAMTMTISWVVLFRLRIHDTYFKSDPWKSYEKVRKKPQFWRYCWGSVVDLRWNPWTDSRVKRKRHDGSNPSSLAMVVLTLRVVRLVREPQYTLDNHAVMTRNDTMMNIMYFERSRAIVGKHIAVLQKQS